LLCHFQCKNCAMGIGTHASRHPCCLCEWDVRDGDNDDLQCTERTFASIRSHYMAWVADGAKKQRRKNFYNCEHEPQSWLPDRGRVIKTCPPSPLHLLIGIVALIVRTARKKGGACESFFDLWIRDTLYLKPTGQHSKDTEYVGNDSRKICSSGIAKARVLFESLRSNCTTRSVTPLRHPAEQFVDCLELFGKIVTACFGVDLCDDIDDLLVEYRCLHLALGINVTPKVHVLFRHVVPFCKENKFGLGVFNEQAAESLHYDFDIELKRACRKNPDNRFFLPMLKRSVVRYNALHQGAVHNRSDDDDDDDDDAPSDDDIDSDDDDERKHDASPPSARARFISSSRSSLPQPSQGRADVDKGAMQISRGVSVSFGNDACMQATQKVRS